MSTQSESVTGAFEQVFENVRKAAETGLKVQKELYQLWAKSWPGPLPPQSPWRDQVQKFQKNWSTTVVDLVAKHRDVIDEQYQAGVDALKDAFSVAEASNPEEFRKRAEELCRKSLDYYKTVAEAQVKEFQDATTKWMDMLTKGAA